MCFQVKIVLFSILNINTLLYRRSKTKTPHLSNPISGPWWILMHSAIKVLLIKEQKMGPGT